MSFLLGPVALLGGGRTGDRQGAHHRGTGHRRSEDGDNASSYPLNLAPGGQGMPRECPD